MIHTSHTTVQCACAANGARVHDYLMHKWLVYVQCTVLVMYSIYSLLVPATMYKAQLCITKKGKQFVVS